MCRHWSVLGLPCLAVPAAWDSDGLPVGLQLVARAGQDRLLLRAAERLLPAFRERPVATSNEPSRGGDV